MTTASAKASADCGFCPVTKLPETTTCDVHGSPLVYLPPLPVRPCSFEPLGEDGVRLRELADPEARRVLAHLAGARAHEEDFFSHLV